MIERLQRLCNAFPSRLRQCTKNALPKEVYERLKHMPPMEDYLSHGEFKQTIGEFFAKYPERLKEFKVKKQPTPREG